MTFLRDEGHIQPKTPLSWSKYFGSEVLYWEVTLDLVIIVDGRNLRFEAMWPSLEEPEAATHRPSVQGQGQFCIAAAFKPGTA